MKSWWVPHEISCKLSSDTFLSNLDSFNLAQCISDNIDNLENIVDRIHPSTLVTLSILLFATHQTHHARVVFCGWAPFDSHRGTGVGGEGVWGQTELDWLLATERPYAHYFLAIVPNASHCRGVVQTEYQNMRENVSPKNAKNAPWLQIAEYLIFCTRDDKDVHNALLTARKMEITNTNTQKLTLLYFTSCTPSSQWENWIFLFELFPTALCPIIFKKYFFRNTFSRIQYSPYFWQWKLPLDRVNMWARQFWHILKQSHSRWGIPRIPHTSIFGVEASLKGRVQKKGENVQIPSREVCMKAPLAVNTFIFCLLPSPNFTWLELLTGSRAGWRLAPSCPSVTAAAFLFVWWGSAELVGVSKHC